MPVFEQVNLPNVLTLARVLSIPVLVVLIPTGHYDLLAAGIFMVASLTDTLDGHLARSRGQVTELGKFLDPLADKLFVLSVLVVLVQQSLLAAWVVVVIFGRELLITILRSLGAAQGKVVAATPFGKTKTVTQVFAILLLILQRPYPTLHTPAQIVVLAAVLFTVLSGVDYLWRFRFLLGSGQPATVEPSAADLVESLRSRGLSIALAESCTGGLVATLLTDQPGSSAVFQGGIVAYSNAVKMKLLGVPESVLEEDGAVSRRTAIAMADGVRTRLGADLGVGITGIAGPEADGSSKPVGLTYVAVISSHWQAVRELRLRGNRWENRRQAALEAIDLVLEKVKREDPVTT
ncbi:MAG TPA: CDP-diacylglycerol--glycerol-3-phosphate 3-phosphatidyltransferase [Candidatus Dormibacteraeota bacterium]|nr:CDP-diacylglycerol--glycerol-3-phosphate 3-phosphatidyltransferase [Candidatus Dormibacteraeota bacterium]